ncbi:TRAP transporter small permease subunit [Euzebya tangerina]|uniref:TRAP transporter small permease subunit n=1 Tax=Euzebya tangerina TaxID=591198 RepID=UPI0013C2DEC6|nr:TRAP transporter small permease subunit [Euzebya tangerina]
MTDADEPGVDGAASPAEPGDLPGWLAALDRVRAGSDRVAEWCGWIAARLMLVIFTVGIFNVILRYVGRATGQTLVSNLWIDTQWQLYALAFLLGFPYGIKHQLNPRVDFWYADFSARRKALIDVVLHTLLLLPFCILAIQLTWPFAARGMGRGFDGTWSTWRLWEVWETSANPDGLPVGPIKLMMTVGFVLFAVQVLAEIIRNVVVIAGHEEVQVVDPDQPLRVE